jgi:hypothetical protein
MLFNIALYFIVCVVLIWAKIKDVFYIHWIFIVMAIISLIIYTIFLLLYIKYTYFD